MVRPVKWRKIEQLPTTERFVPEDMSPGDVQENVLKLEELEALRLKDMEGLDQAECAKKMEVSRPTFQRILLSAREKVADSLVSGKVIRIEGGNYTRNICPMVCLDCGNQWQESYENMSEGEKCASCSSGNIVCNKSRRGRFCRGNCRKYANS